jgi:hypothetical protein
VVAFAEALRRATACGIDIPTDNCYRAMTTDRRASSFHRTLWFVLALLLSAAFSLQVAKAQPGGDSDPASSAIVSSERAQADRASIVAAKTPSVAAQGLQAEASGAARGAQRQSAALSARSRSTLPPLSSAFFSSVPALSPASSPLSTATRSRQAGPPLDASLSRQTSLQERLSPTGTLADPDRGPRGILLMEF